MYDKNTYTFDKFLDRMENGKKTIRGMYRIFVEFFDWLAYMIVLVRYPSQ